MSVYLQDFFTHRSDQPEHRVYQFPGQRDLFGIEENPLVAMEKIMQGILIRIFEEARIIQEPETQICRMHGFFLGIEFRIQAQADVIVRLDIDME